MTDIIKSIQAIKSDAQVTVDNNDINKITWHDGNPTNITNKQITDKITELNADYDSKEYQRKRKEEYPPMEDYLDGIVKDDQAQIDKYIADCKAVKEKYPKWLILVVVMEVVFVENENRIIDNEYFNILWNCCSY